MAKKRVNPKDFCDHPYGSVLGESEAETVAQNIIVMLERTGNIWRPLSWEEYITERRKDNPNIDDWELANEKRRFYKVIKYCSSAEEAKKFSLSWKSPI